MPSQMRHPGLLISAALNNPRGGRWAQAIDFHFDPYVSRHAWVSGTGTLWDKSWYRLWDMAANVRQPSMSLAYPLRGTCLGTLIVLLFLVAGPGSLAQAQQPDTGESVRSNAPSIADDDQPEPSVSAGDVTSGSVPSSTPAAPRPAAEAPRPAEADEQGKRAEAEELPPPSGGDISWNRNEALIASLTIFALAIFLGFEVITKVPPTLHTPLMSGSNAISGITLVGAVLMAGNNQSWWAAFFGMVAVAMATINVVGGFLVTDRMLGMFRKR